MYIFIYYYLVFVYSKKTLKESTVRLWQMKVTEYKKFLKNRS